MSKQTDRKAGAAVLGAGFAVSLVAAPLASAADNPFEVTQFQSGYMVAAEGGCGGAKGAEGACGAGDKQAEGACGGEHGAEGDSGGKSAEGKCGN
jgi:uncharacterized low-complexity protein